MSAPDGELVTYEEAAEMLGVKPSTVKQLVYRDVLHPITKSGSQLKYLARAEIGWYDRRRHGARNEPNPTLETQLRARAEADLTVLEPWVSTVGQETLPSQFSGAALLFLVVLILLAIIANKAPDPRQLEELRTAPQLQPVRRAILKLASEIAA